MLQGSATWLPLADLPGCSVVPWPQQALPGLQALPAGESLLPTEVPFPLFLLFSLSAHWDLCCSEAAGAAGPTLGAPGLVQDHFLLLEQTQTTFWLRQMPSFQPGLPPAVCCR